MQAKSLHQFDQQIQRIKAQLAELGPLRPGTLTRQFRQPQRRRGAYLQISYTYRMKSRTEYVPKEQVAVTRRELADYQRLKKLVAQWLRLGLDRSRLRRKLAQSSLRGHRNPSPTHPASNVGRRNFKK